MCTAIYLKGQHPVFGRTLDYEYTYGEEVVLLPRRYPLATLGVPSVCQPAYPHFALLGMAHVSDGQPLYYDAVNEYGLSVASLNFVGNAAYVPSSGTAGDCPPHALIPTLLAYAKTVEEALAVMQKIRLTDRPPREDYPVGELHFILADTEKCAVIESVEGGVCIYENPAGVLTNNPPFPAQLAALSQYAGLSPYDPADDLFQHTISRMFSLDSHDKCKQFYASSGFSSYTKGRGAIGLPGDYTSTSRFIRAAFGVASSTPARDETEAVLRLFRLLDTVSLPHGSVRTDAGCDLTQYSSAMTLRDSSYTYTTVTNRRPTCIRLSDFDLDREHLYTFPLRRASDVLSETNAAKTHINPQ